MNWKSIENDPPKGTPLLFRLVRAKDGISSYIVGEITNGNDLYFKNEFFDYMYICAVSDLEREGVKAMYYIDPKEILP